MTPMSDEEYRAVRRKEWDEAGKRYGTLAGGALADLMRQATEEILRHAALSAGDDVLDAGTGHGSPAIEAASRVGPRGHVTGIDSAPSMIAGARRRAGEAGIGNVAFLEMDAEDLAFPDERFDAVISRYGYPHFTDAARALKEAHRVLRVGGRFAAAMHGAVEANPYFTAPVLALKAFHAAPASITDRGPFFYHAPDLLKRAMERAGFDEVHAYAYDTTVIVNDFAAYWEAQRTGGASIRRALDAVPIARRAEAEQAALASLSAYVSGNSAVFPAQIVVGAGRKGAGAYQ